VSDGLEPFDADADGVRAYAGLDDPALDSSGFPGPPYTSCGVGADQTGESLLWNASTTGSVAADGTLRNILQGMRVPLEFEDRQTNANGVLACFSGNYREPTVESSWSDGGCATGVIETPLSLLSESDRTAVQQGSAALVDLLETLSNALAVALATIL
jgi:hypothetical protein